MKGLLSGPNPQRKRYASYASFSDTDGSGWLFQEVTARLTGIIEASDTSFTTELANVVRRVEAGKRSRDGTKDLGRRRGIWIIDGQGGEDRSDILACLPERQLNTRSALEKVMGNTSARWLIPRPTAKSQYDRRLGEPRAKRATCGKTRKQDHARTALQPRPDNAHQLQPIERPGPGFARFLR